MTVLAYQPTPLADAWSRVVEGSSTPEVGLQAAAARGDNPAWPAAS